MCDRNRWREAAFTLVLSSVCVCVWQALKQDLSEVFAVYNNFATELEEQSRQLLEKVQQVSCGLNGHSGHQFQSEYVDECGVEFSYVHVHALWDLSILLSFTFESSNPCKKSIKVAAATSASAALGISHHWI